MARTTRDRTAEPPQRLVERRGPLVRRGARRRVAALAVLGVVTTAVLAGRFAGDRGAGRTDRELAELVDMQHGSARALGQVFAALGGPVPVVVALLVLTPLAWALRGGRGLALVLIGPALAMVTTSLVLKPLVERTRNGDLAFPSGHTTSVGSIAVACAVLVLGLPVGRSVRLAAVAALGGLVLAVAVSLVGREVHYPTDTLGAVGVAVAVVLLIALAIDAWADVVADPGPDPGPEPRAGDPRDRPTDVLPRLGHPAG